MSRLKNLANFNPGKNRFKIIRDRIIFRRKIPDKVIPSNPTPFTNFTVRVRIVVRVNVDIHSSFFKVATVKNVYDGIYGDWIYYVY